MKKTDIETLNEVLSKFMQLRESIESAKSTLGIDDDDSCEDDEICPKCCENNSQDEEDDEDEQEINTEDTQVLLNLIKEKKQINLWAFGKKT